jgi:hypothetical protein
MNCKPGDLAVIVQSPPEVAHNIGKIVQVTTTTTSWDGVLCWRLKEPFPDVVCGVPGTCYGIADAHLRPIRDPGDDARDQTLSWLPVPTTTKKPEHA